MAWIYVPHTKCHSPPGFFCTSLGSGNPNLNLPMAAIVFLGYLLDLKNSYVSNLKAILKCSFLYSNRVVDLSLNQSQTLETVFRSLGTICGFVSKNVQGTNLQPCQIKHICSTKLQGLNQNTGLFLSKK